jgi:methanogenic corrinoid protein MtbC1
MKRWIDDGRIAASRTAGGHRRIALGEAIQFVRSSTLQIVSPERLGLPELGVADGAGAPVDSLERLKTFLREGRSFEARGLILSLYLDGQSVAALCDGPLKDALREIGDIWEEDPSGIYVEHRATDIVNQSLNLLRSIVENGAPGLTAVGGAVEGDPYMLPTLMAATALQAEGIQAVNLGPNTPAASFALAAQEHGADFVWASVTASRDRPALTRMIAELASRLAEAELPLVLGGQGVDGWQPRDLDNVHVGRSIAELVGYAKGIMGIRRPS